MIAAMDRNRVIGSKSGGISWDLPRDRNHFRNYTAAKWMLIGRATYEEMEGWFTDQIPIVITRQIDYCPAHPDHRVATSIEEAIETAREHGALELIVSGGATLYAAALPLANQLILTRIEHSFDGDLVFPDFENSDHWTLTSSEPWPSDHENAYAMNLEIWQNSR